MSEQTLREALELLLYGSIDAEQTMTPAGDEFRAVYPPGTLAKARAVLATTPAPVAQPVAMIPVEILERFPEINPSNYDHDDVCDLNSWGVEVVMAATEPKDKP